MLKSKIHRATVTDARLDYEGSISIDQHLLEMADIIPFERVEVYNITNGERFSTYAIPASALSGIICINGAAARKVLPKDLIIIASFVNLTDEESKYFKPKVVKVTSLNQAVPMIGDRVI